MIRKKKLTAKGKAKTKKTAPKSSKTLKKAGGKKLSAKLKAKAPTKTKSQMVAGLVESNYKLNEGDVSPNFTLPATGGKKISASALKGHIFVLYFYPKDNTPGCTLEGHDFKKLHKQFQSMGCEIFGVSKDSLKSHENFSAKCGFPFELLSDEEGTLCKAFDVIQMKSMYGKKFEGIERSTFVIGADGKVKKAWRKVKVEGHADEVLGFVRNQKGS